MNLIDNELYPQIMFEPAIKPGVFEKVNKYVSSCKCEDHLMVANKLVERFKAIYPKSTVVLTKLLMTLQLRRIEIDYMHKVVNHIKK